MNVMELVAKITLNASSFKAGIQDAINELKNIGPETGNIFQQVGAGLNALGKMFTPVSMAAGAIFVPAVKSALSFEDQIAKVNTLIPQGTASVKELKDMFLDLSNATGRSTADLAEAGYQALSAGVNYDDLSGFIETATNLSKVGFTETATAVDILTTTINAYGDSAGSAEEIANKLLLTQNYGKTTVDELAQSMGRVIPIASSAGVSIDDLTTAYALMTKQGINTRIATTDLSSLISELSASSGDLATILQEQTGMSFEDLMADGKNLNDVLMILKNYADENNLSFKELFSSTTAQASALALTNDEAGDYNEIMKEMQENDTAVSEALDKLNTNGAKIRKMWTQLKNLLIEIGSAFLDVVAPAIEQFGNFVGDLANKFHELSEPVKQAIGVVLGVLTALAPALKIGGLVMNVIGGIVDVITALSAPIVAVIAVIALFVGALISLWNNNEEFRAKMQSAWQAIQDIVGKVVDVIKSYIDEIKAWIDSVMPTIEALWQGIQDFVQNIVEFFANIIELIDAFINGDMQGVSSAVQGIIGNIGGIIMSLVGIVGNLFSLIISAIASYIGSVVSTAVNFCTSVINAVKSFASQMWNAGVEWIQNLVNGILDKVTDVYNSVTNLANQAKSKFEEVNWGSVGSNIISGIVNGISSAAGSLFDSLRNLASNALESAKSALGINSPSKVFARDVGLSIPEGVALGVERGMPDLMNEIDDYMNQIVKPVDAKLNFKPLLEVGDQQGGLLDAVYTSIRQGIEDANIRVYMGDREVTRSMKDMGFVYD